MPEPLTVSAIALLLPYASSMEWSGNRSGMLRGETAVSIQQRACFSKPSSMVESMNIPMSSFHADAASSFEWLGLAQAVFGNSRSMTTEERDALDEFFWAELRA
jgi:hypothetical protein